MSSITITQEIFGTFQNPVTNKTEDVIRFTFLNTTSGVTIQAINYGATITSFKCPNRDGTMDDIVLGFDDMDGYKSKGNRYFGATVGRVANRIGNGKFTLDGKEYQLPINNGPNSLHGGVVGFDKRMWEAEVVDGTEPKVVFSLLSADGDEGYPGNLIAQVSFQLLDDQLKIEYQAMTTKPTPIALTNHSYFNLGGHQNSRKKLEGHFVQLNADNYTPKNENNVPNGQIISVKGSLYDLTGNLKDLKGLLEQFPPGPNGYDNNFCINQYKPGKMEFAARFQYPSNGRVLEVYTDQPGMQFYTADFLPDPDSQDLPTVGKQGAKYWKNSAFCLEAQNFPDAVNHENFPNAILRPGEIYRQTTIYKVFSVK